MRITAAITLLAVLFSAGARAEDKAALSFAELHGGKTETVTIERWKGKPLLVLFWRSDCVPCLQEIKLLPAMAKDAYVPIALISLQDAEHTRVHLPSLPENVHILVASGDGREVLSAFGNAQTLAMPYSVMLDKKGEVCGKQYGLLSPDKIKEWRKQC